MTTKDQIEEIVLQTFTCVELAEMARKKFAITRKRIIEEHGGINMAATVKIASLEAAMWSDEKRKSIEEHFAYKPYRPDYNEL